MAYRWEGDALIVELFVQPKASQDQIVGLHDGRIRIRIAAPPVDGKANQCLIRFLAKQFGVPKSRIILEKGENSRKKRCRILNPQKIPELIRIRLLVRA